jgi:hypothetical protein
VIEGSTIEQLIAWCRATDAELTRLTPLIDAERRRRALRLLHATQPALVAAAQLIDAAVGQRADPSAARQPAHESPADRIAAVLRRLDAEADEPHHAEVWRIAAKTHEAAANGRERIWLIELKEKIRQANAVVEDCRLAAAYLAALDPAGSDDEPRGPDTLLRCLRDIRDGRTPFGAHLKAESGRALGEIELTRKQAYILHQTREALDDLGFDVDHVGARRLRGSHCEWPGCLVEFAVDERLRLSAHLQDVRGVMETGHEQIAEWRRRYAPVEVKLTESGISASLEPVEKDQMRFERPAEQVFQERSKR